MGLIRRLICGGTTSACAENTPCPQSPTHPCWNYLRVRGEYRSNHFFHASVLELPPRARRIPAPITFCENQCGTTSACAENTCSNHILRKSMWNYLRVRGEYWCATNECACDAELPPRARRIRYAHHGGTAPMGTTSACAENTGQKETERTPSWNYLRVRGEYLQRDFQAPLV